MRNDFDRQFRGFVALFLMLVLVKMIAIGALIGVGIYFGAKLLGVLP